MFLRERARSGSYLTGDLRVDTRDVEAFTDAVGSSVVGVVSDILTLIEMVDDLPAFAHWMTLVACFLSTPFAASHQPSIQKRR